MNKWPSSPIASGLTTAGFSQCALAFRTHINSILGSQKTQLSLHCCVYRWAETHVCFLKVCVAMALLTNVDLYYYVLWYCGVFEFVHWQDGCYIVHIRQTQTDTEVQWWKRKRKTAVDNVFIKVALSRRILWWAVTFPCLITVSCFQKRMPLYKPW